ncbi:MAG: MucR family transcriptional regulator [Alphaproteobacteria bacterium]
MNNNQVGTAQPQISTSEIMNLTTEIVASYVSNNPVEASDLNALIQSTYKSLSEIAAGRSYQASRPEPVVSIKKSVSDDYIICLEDGKKLKMLKRHLKSAYNMTPEQYRERWGLAPDYPMVAPSYARQRSELAKTIGLGTRPRGKARIEQAA